jgi:hypothetical protein
LSGRIVAALRMGQRAEIPFDNLAQVLITNRFTCCVCHDPSKSIIVHHIREWSVSHDHSPKNLACVCLEHHDKAHSTSTLSRNLDAKCLRAAKISWESEVARLNTTAILDSSRAKSDAWLHFNHRRLFELAASFKDIKGFRSAGSLTWGGVHNTYFCIDLEKRITAVVLMQILPIGDPHVQERMIGLERALYTANASIA